MSLSNLLKEVRDLKSKGVKIVDLDKLENALVQAESNPSPKGEWDIKVAELKHQSTLAEYQATQQNNMKLLEATITFAGAALKSAMLINGGAAVAILAYLGNSHADGSARFAYSLLCFTLGVLFAAVATATSYIAQFNYTHDKERAGDRVRLISILIISFSFLGFIAGSYLAFLGFIHK